MNINIKNILLLLLLLGFAFSCARMGTPDGGPYDEDPPKLLHTSPKFGALNVSPKKIVLDFDENEKLESASEKIIISPPQHEQPDIEASGKTITVTLHDSIVKGTTYTIDFGDAIVDNNEGNSFGNYTYTFSSYDKIDTMQVSGYVLEAKNLEPIKRISVLLYSLDNDSIPKAISYTDASGHFCVKGLAPGDYKIYALQDQDGDFKYSQKSEKMAFTDRIIHPTCAPDVRMDTLWHDSLHYDSIVRVKYTHFYPDDITLLVFTPTRQSRHLMKYERQRPNIMRMIFSGTSDQLPIISGLNFDATDAFIVECNEGNDTITYWVKDEQVSRLDTLKFLYTYMANDTNEVLIEQTDTMLMYSKLTNEKLDKLKQQKEEKHVKEWKKKHKKDLQDNPNIQIPPMDEEFMEYKVSTTNITPDQNIHFTFPEPIREFNTNLVRLYEKIDTNLVKRDFIIKDNTLYAEWMPGSRYELDVDTGAVISIYGKRIEGCTKNVSVKKLESLSNLFVKLQKPSSLPFVVELLNTNDKVLKRIKTTDDGRADFFFLIPGKYYLRAFCDENNNGVWDSGDFEIRKQPECVYYYPRQIPLKANFDVEQIWVLDQTPVFEQKPAAITKQKADKKKKTMKSKNEERLRNLGRIK